jgi:hypothetical protein
MREHHTILVIVIASNIQKDMSITKEDLRKGLLARPALETTKQGITSLIIQMFLLITRKLPM